MSDLHALVIEDDVDIRLGCLQALALADISAQGFESAEEASPLIGSDFAGVVVCDIQLPGIDGLSFMRQTLQKDATLPFIVVTSHGDPATADEALRDGAYDFIQKPFSSRRLVMVVRQALAARAHARAEGAKVAMR